MKQARRFLFFGRVQGVFFRAQARAAARALELTGWVRNLPDGSVEAHAEGEPEALREFERRATTSFRSAAVERCEVEEAAVEGHPGFEVRY